MVKKVAGLLLVFLFLVPFQTFAYNPNENTAQVEVPEDFASLPSSITVEGNYVCVDDTVDNVDGQFKPLTTCSGDGGYARLDSVFGTGGAVRWEINPRFSTAHVFTGSLTILRYQNGVPVFYDSIPISCSGVFGEACGDYVELGLPSGTYSVSISGTARDASGLFSWIVPPCTIGISF
jgi:hypothetical protein